MNPRHAIVLASALALATRVGHAEEAPAQAFAEPPTKRHSPGLMAGGIVLTTLGAIQTGIATGIFIEASRSRSEYSGIFTVFIGVPLFVNGIGGLAGGIPMIVIGAKSIPDTSPRAQLSFVPQMGGGALRLTF